MDGEKEKWWGDEREVAELIWCAAHLHRIIAPPTPKDVERGEDLRPPDGNLPPDKPFGSGENPTPPTAEEIEPPPGSTHIATNPKDSKDSPTSPKKPKSASSNHASPVRVPDPFPLPQPAAISKMLLPLAKRVPGVLVNEFDIDATVEQTAEANGLPMMAFRLPLERWFEVHLLIDCSPSMAFWGDLAQGVATLFRWQGFFRDVRVWQFETQNSEPRLFSGSERLEREIPSLIAPGRNRLFVVLTDTLGKAWHSGAAFAALAVLGERHPVTIAHVFPQTLWQRTALHQAIQKPLVAPHSGCANSMLKVGARLHTKAPLYRFPIFNLSPNHFATWANFLAGSGGNSIQGVLIRSKSVEDKPKAEEETSEVRQEALGVIKVDSSKPVEDKPKAEEETPEDLLRGFLTDASPEARELAKVLAAVPLIPPVMRLAQQQFLRDSEHWHLAEVFFSGLLQKSPLGPKETTVPETWYEFKPGIRELLLENSPVLRTAEIWREIGDFIQHRYGSPRDFRALIPNPGGSIQNADVDQDSYFAEVDAAVLMTWGGEYTSRAQELREQVAARKGQIEAFQGFPPIEPFEFSETTITIENDNLRTFEFRVPTITIEDEPIINLQPFEFEVATIEPQQTRGLFGFGQKTELIVKRRRQQSQYFIENLGNRVQLEMVEIPGGSFQMGAPQREKDSSDHERPQHQVNVPTFFMGKYPITQAQWQAVASLPQINRELQPNPSRFEGENRPVEQVSWYDAVEFCSRLSQHTGKTYSLPSEAQWEYACRAGTTTPFYFGETITSELANYNANSTYGAGEKGTYREQTTAVGSLNAANNFGLYDMHGNVWEWCLDDWHSNYQGAPIDGSAWFNNDDKLFDKTGQAVLRGGSWSDLTRNCRSASRYTFVRVERDYVRSIIGFRVVCAAGRIL
jgi:formylglycine-generating enzyme required for sulfatase activity